MSLNLDDLTVDTFATTDDNVEQVPIVYTVLHDTEWISCGGSCATCPVCYA